MKKLINKILFSLGILVSTAAPSHSYSDLCCPMWVCCHPCCSSIELKGGYFTFADKRMRKVYDGGGIVQLSGSHRLCDLCDGFRLDLYGSVGFLYCSGRSLNDHQKTSIWQVPVDLGLKPVFTICPGLELYAAVGPRYFYLHQHNDSSYVYRDRGKSGIAVFVNTGVNYFICRNFFVDIFGEYSYGKVHLNGKHSGYYTRDLQVGGYTVGAGLGFVF